MHFGEAVQFDLAHPFNPTIFLGNAQHLSSPQFLGALRLVRLALLPCDSRLRGRAKLFSLALPLVKAHVVSLAPFAIGEASLIGLGLPFALGCAHDHALPSIDLSSPSSALLDRSMRCHSARCVAASLLGNIDETIGAASFFCNGQGLIPMPALLSNPGFFPCPSITNTGSGRTFAVRRHLGKRF